MTDRNFWDFFHIMAKVLNVTSKTREEVYDCQDSFIIIFQLLAYQNMYPNKKYANTLESFMSQYNIKKYVDTKELAFKYTYLLHSYVNVYTKKNNSISLAEASKKYDNLTIDNWGPAYWKVIHKICFSLPQGSLNGTEKKNILIFFSAIRFLVPCPECKSHLTKFLTEQPLYKNYSTGKSVAEWACNLHNSVNQRLGKKIVSFQEAYHLFA